MKRISLAKALLLEGMYCLTNEAVELIIRDPKEAKAFLNGKEALALNDDGEKVKITKEECKHWNEYNWPSDK